MKIFFLIFLLLQTANAYFECLDNYSKTSGLYALSNCLIDSLEGNYEFCGNVCFEKSNCIGFNYIDLVNVTNCELLCNISDFDNYYYSDYFEKTGVACYTRTVYFLLCFVGGICLIFIPPAIWIECRNRRRRNDGYHAIN